MVTGIPDEVAFAILNPEEHRKRQEAYEAGYEAAKKEMLKYIKKMEALKTSTSTVSNF